MLKNKLTVRVTRIRIRPVIQVVAMAMVIAVCPSLGNSALAQDQAVVDRLKSKIKTRNEFFDRFYKGGMSLRSGALSQATLTVLSEEAIAFNADKSNVTATDEEVFAILEPFLSQQGIIDLASTPDLRSDPNIQLWLHAQNLTFDDLMRSGRTLALWTKVACKDVKVTGNEVEAFIDENPQVRLLPTRVKVTIKKYVQPATGATRSLSPFEQIAPRLGVALTRDIETQKTDSPEGWERLSLYLNLNDIDPNLRQALGGKKPRDKFGPILLRNGALIEGSVDAITPESDLSRNIEFWKMAALRTRLEKADQLTIYQEMVQAYLNAQGPAVRNIFGDAFDFFKKNLGTVASIAGAGIGFLVGGPPGAIAGAQIGNQVGSTVQGWVNGRPPTYQQINTLASNMGVALPPMPQLPSPPPVPSFQISNYLTNPAPLPLMRPAYQPSPTVPWSPNYNQIAYSGLLVSTIPLMPSWYPTVFGIRISRYPDLPPPVPMWAPPMFVPFGPFFF